MEIITYSFADASIYWLHYD